MVSLYWLKTRVLKGKAQKVGWEWWCKKVKVREKREVRKRRRKREERERKMGGKSMKGKYGGEKGRGESVRLGKKKIK